MFALSSRSSARQTRRHTKTNTRTSTSNTKTHLQHDIEPQMHSPRRFRPPHQMRVGNIHEPQAVVDVPRYSLRDRLKLFDATVTPQLLCVSGTWTMTEEMKKELQTTQRRMNDHADKERKQVKVTQLRSPRASTTPPTWNPATPTANLWTTQLTEHSNQHLNEHDDSSHDPDNNPCFDVVPNDELRRRSRGHLLAASGITLWIPRQSQVYWREARMIGKQHEDRWTKLVSIWKPTVSTQQDQPSLRNTLIFFVALSGFFRQPRQVSALCAGS